MQDIYSLARVWPNSLTYARWLVESQTPLVLVALVSPWVLWRAGVRPSVLWILTIAFPVTAIAIYLPYLVFPEWSTLRFLLPAYPPVLAGVAATLVSMVRGARARTLATASLAALVVMVAVHGVQYANGPLKSTVNDSRYARVLDYVGRVPEPAVFVSLSHSGTIAFYTGRDVLRWEVLAPEALDVAVDYLGATGRRVHLVVDDIELEPFLARFAMSRSAHVIAGNEAVALGGVRVVALGGHSSR